jgi:hypothetical protein
MLRSLASCITDGHLRERKFSISVSRDASQTGVELFSKWEYQVFYPYDSDSMEMDGLNGIIHAERAAKPF